MVNKTYSNHIDDVLLLVRDELSRPLVTLYREQFPHSLIETVRTVIGKTSSHIPHSVTNDTLAEYLDAYGVLRLITGAPCEMKSKLTMMLGDDYLRPAQHLYILRNAEAHKSKRKTVTLDDATMASKLAYDLFFELNNQAILQKLTEIIRNLEVIDESLTRNTFAPSIQRINNTINTLTEEQMNVFQELRRKRRVAVNGCAGSGKTLLAVEKALRQDEAGYKTLILCRNPRLAHFIRRLTERSDVNTFDFCAWVARINRKETQQEAEWTQYDTPTEDELLLALENIPKSGEDYDAVIVDEAQDFEEDWWALVNAALEENIDSAVLYIFYDEHQMLVPHELTYPVDLAEHTLQQNIRNSGKVFEFVAKFHPQSPAPNSLLRNTGYIYPFKLNNFSKTDVHAKAREAFVHSQKILDDVHSLVFITTEDVPILLNGLQMPARVDWDWQRVVRSYFRGIVQHPAKIEMGGEFEELDRVLNRDVYGDIDAGQWLPSEQHCELVSKLAQTARDRLKKMPPAQVDDFPWKLYSNKKHTQLGTYDRKYLDYFCGEKWHKDLHNIASLVVGENLPLYTIDEFKGLEAEGVILLIHQPSDSAWDSKIYVGASRAKALLCVISDMSNLL